MAPPPFNQYILTPNSTLGPGIPFAPIIPIAPIAPIAPAFPNTTSGISSPLHTNPAYAHHYIYLLTAGCVILVLCILGQKSCGLFDCCCPAGHAGRREQRREERLREERRLVQRREERWLELGREQRQQRQFWNDERESLRDVVFDDDATDYRVIAMYDLEIRPERESGAEGANGGMRAGMGTAGDYEGSKVTCPGSRIL